MSALLLVSALSHGNTERFMPTSNKLLAMCPSVCRSAPPRMFMPISLRQRTSVHWIYLDRNGTDRQYRKIYAHKEWAIGNVSINLPFRSAPTLNFSWSERNGNTERFMPTSNKLLAMCPSVCRSAPPRCSCLFHFVKEHPFTEFILIGTERQYRKIYAHRAVSYWQCVHHFS